MRTISTTDRAKQILERPFRFFYHEDFDNPALRRQILGPMPDYDDYKKQQDKLLALKNKDVDPELRPCYEQPMLTREQEVHLFRKMNYLKYQAKKLLDMPVDTWTHKMMDKIDYFIHQAEQVRNQIATANLRLATQPLKKQMAYIRQGMSEILLSDGYFDVLKAVDYFNFNYGSKFSTYCTWVIRKNLSRANQQRSAQEKKYVTGMDEDFEAMEDDEEANYRAYQHEKTKQLADDLLNLLRDAKGTKNSGNVDRQLIAIRKLFGLGDCEKQTLESVGQDLGLSKERIRQLRERGLKTIRAKAIELGYTLD